MGSFWFSDVACYRQLLESHFPSHLQRSIFPPLCPTSFTAILSRGDEAFNNLRRLESSLQTEAALRHGAQQISSQQIDAWTAQRQICFVFFFWVNPWGKWVALMIKTYWTIQWMIDDRYLHDIWWCFCLCPGYVYAAAFSAAKNAKKLRVVSQCPTTSTSCLGRPSATHGSCGRTRLNDSYDSEHSSVPGFPRKHWYGIGF